MKDEVQAIINALREELTNLGIRKADKTLDDDTRRVYSIAYTDLEKVIVWLQFFNR